MGRRALLYLVLAATGVAACGDDGRERAAPDTTRPAGRSATATVTSNDGVPFRITVEVGPAGDAPPPAACAPALDPGQSSIPVTLRVVNEADRAAPFPPLRIELTADGGGAPRQVQVRDRSGMCTFAPRAPQLGPRESVVFEGATPAIPKDMAPGGAGRVEVKISETAFSLSAPVP